MERRLAAILAVDVVGYSRLMGRDDVGTLAALKAVRAETVDPKIAEHKGRIFKDTGDGVLGEFPSVVEAVNCAVDIQQKMLTRNSEPPDDRAIQLRIGINVGDVIVEGTDIFGDGVNIAARIQALAAAGGVAVSGFARDQLGHGLELQFEDMGEQKLKNIEREIRVYQIKLGERSTISLPPLALPDKPSIAVLPFTNMSGDPEQEYFADGIVEEIITALSRMRWLFVIARNSSFTYKGRAVDVRQVGRELGVRYMLEGSVRKAEGRIRITGQLIDTANGSHLWGDRFEGALADIFDLQDRVAESVISAIGPRLEKTEIERSRRKPTGSLGAYDHYLRGLSAIHEWTRPSNAEALSQFHRAIELDPEFAAAYGMAARCYSIRKASSWMDDASQEIAEAARLAKRAAELGKDDAVALATAGIALSFVVGDLDGGRELTGRATAIDPNMAWAWLFSGWTRVWLGEHEAANVEIARALRLSPLDPHRVSMFAAMASSYFFVGRYDEALAWAECSVRLRSGFVYSTLMVAASAALVGNHDRARGAVAQLADDHPDMSISKQQFIFPLRRQQDIARLTEGLRKAGLRE